MKVVLIQNVKGLGQKHEIKEVKNGYAMNFLIPRGLAKVADGTVERQISDQKKADVKKQQKKTSQAKIIAQKINNLKIEVKAKADEGKTLFGSISQKEIARELNNRGYQVDSENIILDEPIKKLGFYEIQLKFAPEVTAKLGLTVTRDK